MCIERLRFGGTVQWRRRTRSTFVRTTLLSTATSALAAVTFLWMNAWNPTFGEEEFVDLVLSVSAPDAFRFSLKTSHPGGWFRRSCGLGDGEERCRQSFDVDVQFQEVVGLI